ncbi:MAG: hypothetical protein R3E12_02660 [Candidatus Eisenbacteria bacterium]
MHSLPLRPWRPRLQISTLALVLVLATTVLPGGKARAAWSPIDGIPGGGNIAAVGSDVWAVEVYDDGTGAALYAAGGMDVMGTGQGRGVFRWDGQNWDPIGTIPLSDTVYCMEVWDGKLIVAGIFTEVDGEPRNRIAAWDGASWSALGVGMPDGWVWELAVWENDLIATGTFTQAGGTSALGIARWDGSSWSALGSGINGDGRALEVFEGDLVVGGAFTTAGGVNAVNVARWDGSSWSAIGSGVPSTRVYALTAYDADGDGPDPERLLAGGTLCTTCNSNLVVWDGANWSSFAGTFGGSGVRTVNALETRGDDLLVAGTYQTVAGIPAQRVALWNATSGWSPLGTGLNPESTSGVTVWDLTLFGTDVIAAGTFWNDGTVAMKGIARFDGSSWQALASGLGGVVDPQVYALVAVEEGLAVGGRFTSVGNAVNANNVALYTTSGWQTLGPGIGGESNEDAAVNSLVVHEGELHAAYQFFATSGGWRTGVARWDGTEWMTILSIPGSSPNVRTLASHGDGLYAGGSFTSIGATVVNRIARWDGISWEPLGSGLNNVVNAVLSFGDDIIAGGNFTIAGGRRPTVWPAGTVRSGHLWGRVCPLRWSVWPNTEARSTPAVKEVSIASMEPTGPSWAQAGSAISTCTRCLPPLTDSTWEEASPRSVEARRERGTWRFGQERNGRTSTVGSRSSAPPRTCSLSRIGTRSIWTGSNLFRAGTEVSAYLARWSPDAASVEEETGIDSESATGPIRIFTARAWPSGGVALRVDLREEAVLRLAIFDAAGRRRVEDSPGRMTRGEHEWIVPATTVRRLGSGVYFARLEAIDRRTATRSTTSARFAIVR